MVVSNTKQKTKKEVTQEFISSETERTRKLSNRDLLEDTLLASFNMNDDYYNEEVEVTYDILRKELFSRLSAWLS